ncbi:NAD(+)/NADH kinase [Patescibacteria group bacterium]|nr:NAD(+)/NADH kinase [Patescibacteria group bacterium]MCG2694845.1 NAD(+)/NADH kinase [Candidatus Parcubacteria bacterium]
MKFIITAHPEKDNAQKTKSEMERWLKEESHEVVSQNEDADLVIVLGGDGFVMHNIAKFSQRDIPCLGINAGNVGFLTSGNILEWREILKKVLGGNYKIEKRIGLELELDGKKFGPFANDVYLKHPTSMGSFNVKIDSENIYKNLNSDGFIVSTPTGSTGYNVSAGGPIIQPGIFSLVLTPICPVHLNIRSLVINPDSEIEIEFLGSRNSDPVYLVADGQTVDEISDKNRKIIIRRHPKKLLFAVLDNHHFYKALQDKKGLMK